MILSNYHSHFNMDDGSGELSDYADSAIERGLSIIGISPHAPLFYENDWTMRETDLPEYFRQVNLLKKDYSGRLEIYRGLEIDYISGHMGPADSKYKDYDLDYCIGSVHSMREPVTEEYLSVDGPVEEFISLLENRCGNDIKKLVRDYYQLQIEMIQLGNFDILGHCDLIKKRNTDNRFFNQDEKWYRSEAFEMLKTAAAKDIILEVNTGGLSRNATVEVYPSQWMLEQCFKLNIPITLSADAHNPDHIDFYFKEALEQIKSCGYGEIYFFSAGKWQNQPI